MLKKISLIMSFCALSGQLIAEVQAPKRWAFDVISTSKNIGLTQVIIARDISGRHCPKKSEQFSSYSLAIQDALSQVPAANALVDVKTFLLKKTFGSDCIEVHGNAVQI